MEKTCVSLSQSFLLKADRHPNVHGVFWRSAQLVVPSGNLVANRAFPTQIRASVPQKPRIRTRLAGSAAHSTKGCAPCARRADVPPSLSGASTELGTRRSSLSTR